MNSPDDERNYLDILSLAATMDTVKNNNHCASDDVFVTRRDEIDIKVFDPLRSNVASPNCIAQFLIEIDQFDVTHPCVKNSAATLLAMDPNFMTTKITEKKYIQYFKRKLKEGNPDWPWSSIQDNRDVRDAKIYLETCRKGY